MKRLVALLTALCLALVLIPACAEEGEGLTIVSENFIVRETYIGTEGVYMAKIQNNAGIPLYLEEGSLALLDADGDLIGSASFPYPCGSIYLEPGETTFLAISAEVDAGTTVADYRSKIKAAEKSYSSPDTIVTVTGTELSIDYNYDNYAIVTVTAGEEPLFNIQVIVALEDADGVILDIAATSLYGAELAAGSTVRMWVGLDDSTLKLLRDNGITPARVEAFAWVAGY